MTGHQSGTFDHGLLQSGGLVDFRIHNNGRGKLKTEEPSYRN